MKKYKNENLQKLIILEGFMQNGHYHRNQRIFLRRTSYVKIDFRHSLKTHIFLLNMSKSILTHDFLRKKYADFEFNVRFA